MFGSQRICGDFPKHYTHKHTLGTLKNGHTHVPKFGTPLGNLKESGAIHSSEFDWAKTSPRLLLDIEKRLMSSSSFLEGDVGRSFFFSVILRKPKANHDFGGPRRHTLGFRLWSYRKICQYF